MITNGFISLIPVVISYIYALVHIFFLKYWYNNLSVSAYKYAIPTLAVIKRIALLSATLSWLIVMPFIFYDPIFRQHNVIENTAYILITTLFFNFWVAASRYERAIFTRLLPLTKDQLRLILYSTAFWALMLVQTGGLIGIVLVTVLAKKYTTAKTTLWNSH
jgi:hypothetical protein